MNNEPVAWMHQNPDYAISKHQSLEYNIPLYTHPVKEHFEDEPQAEELHEILQSNAELTPCEELRVFQEQQNGVFSDHNACCYRHECRIVWNDWEKIRSNPVEEQDESFDRTASHMAGEYVSWTSCVACGQRVTSDSIHTCSPQLKQLTDEEMKDLIQEYWGDVHIVDPDGYLHEIAFIRAILRKAQEK